jgi:hypothetical protein
VDVDEATIRELVRQLNTAQVALEAQAWEQLRTLDEAVVPFLEEAYPTTSKWQARLSLVFHAIPFARTSEPAFRLGVAALGDRSFMIRYRACGLLAYSGRREALPALEALLDHPDLRTVEDARAAIAAIEERNHHLFVDRQRTGQVFWEVRRRE